ARSGLKIRPRKRRIVLFEGRAHSRKVRLRNRGKIRSDFRHIRSQQRTLCLATQGSDATDIPVELAALDPRSAERARAVGVFLQRRATTRTVQRRRLFWAGRKHVALTLKLPTLADVVTHLAAGIFVRGPELSVVRLKANADSDGRGVETAHVKH